MPVLPVDGIVSLPALGAVRVGAAPAVVHSSADRAEVRWADGRAEIPQRACDDEPGWQGIRNCQAGSLRVAIDDLDPFRMPAVAGLAPRLTAVAARRWERVLDAGWSVLAAGHPTAAAEAAAAISAIVPMSNSAHGQLSSSSPEAFGAVAMSEPPDPVTCAVTLTHEVQHLKLCAVRDIVRLTKQDDGRRYYVPWRADPRPIAGLLQGAYAYLGVTEFWRRQRQLAAGAARLKAESEFALWRAGTARVMDTLLSSGGLTWAGTAFVRRMSETASAWAGEPVSTAAKATALRESRRHLDRWELEERPGPVLIGAGGHGGSDRAADRSLTSNRVPAATASVSGSSGMRVRAHLLAVSAASFAASSSAPVMRRSSTRLAAQQSVSG